jgi:hypothetical protein
VIFGAVVTLLLLLFIIMCIMTSHLRTRRKKMLHLEGIKKREAVRQRAAEHDKFGGDDDFESDEEDLEEEVDPTNPFKRTSKTEDHRSLLHGNVEMTKRKQDYETGRQ